MTKKEVNIKGLLALLVVGVLLWNYQTSAQLSPQAWKLFVIFLITILGIIGSVMPMGAIAALSITTISLTGTLPIGKALSGFSHPIAWLVVMAFFIARGFIKTNLGRRLAYFLITKLGHTTIGLSYSILFSEYILSPMIPSTSARGGGIIYPITKSLAEAYDAAAGKMSRTGAFLISTCFHGNVICCALFLTAMAGNPLVLSLSKATGVHLTWTDWAIAASVPGLINLLYLPHLTAFLLKPEKKGNKAIIATAKQELAQMGALSRNEIVMLLTFALMLGLWILGSNIGIDATTAAFIGFVILLITGVINWNDVISEKSAWDTFLWFSVLLMLSENLTSFKVDAWVGAEVNSLVSNLSPLLLVGVLYLMYYYGHYFFASVTAHITVMFSIFLMLLTTNMVPPTLAAMSLAILSNLSAGLTHYGINTAPIYFSAGYFTTKQWMRIGFIVATVNLIFWSIFGTIWWKTIGLW